MGDAWSVRARGRLLHEQCFGGVGEVGSLRAAVLVIFGEECVELSVDGGMRQCGRHMARGARRHGDGVRAGMWCWRGCGELPICSRMRGSGWRMGGVSWCEGRQRGRRALCSGVLAIVGIALQIFVGVRGRGWDVADERCGEGRHNVRDGVSGRGRRRRGRGVRADRARDMWWGRCGCVRGGVLCVGGMAV